MSRFYASITGQAKTTATRRGSKTSGIYGHIRGWNKGVRVEGYIDKDGNDCFDIYETNGSNNPSNKLIKTI